MKDRRSFDSEDTDDTRFFKRVHPEGILGINVYMYMFMCNKGENVCVRGID